MTWKTNKNKVFLSAFISLVVFIPCVLFFSLLREKNEPSIAISGIKPKSASVSFGIKPIGKNWNYQTVKVNNIFYPNSIFAHAPSDLIFINTKDFRSFQAACAVEDHVGEKGSVQFVVFTDDELSYRSPIIRGGGSPVPLFISIAGKKKIELLVREIENLDYDHAVWLNPAFLLQKPLNQPLTASVNKTGAVANISWETGGKPFPNKSGLMIWNFFALFFYLYILRCFIVRKKPANNIRALLLKFKSYLKQPSFYIMLLTSFLLIWITLPIFRSGLPTAWDMGRHLLSCRIMKDICLSSFKLDGINPYWYLGVQSFLFDAPLFYIITCFFHFLTFQLVPLDICFKIFFVSSFILLPFAFYWLARQLDIPSLPSALAALCVPAFSAVHGMGIEALFVIGLLPQCFSLVIFCLAFGALLNSIKFGSKHIFISGMLISLLNLSHIVSTVFFYFLLLIVLLFELWPHRNISFRHNLIKLPRILVPAVLGLLISSFFIFTSMQFYSLRGPDSAFGRFTYYDFLCGLFSGGYFATFPIHLIVLLGLMFSLFLKNRVLIVMAILSVLVPVFSTADLLNNLNLLGLPWRLIFQYRIFAYVAVFFMVFLALGIQAIMVSFPRIIAFAAKSFKISRLFMRPALYAVLIMFLSVNVIVKLQFLRPSVKSDADFDGIDKVCIYNAWDWIKTNTPENIVIDYEHRGGAGNLGFIDIGTRTNIFADRYTLSGGHTEITKAHNYNFLDRINTIASSELFSLLKRYNVSYFYTWNDDARDNIAKYPNLFHKVYENFKICVWQVMGHDFRYLANDDLKIKSFCFSSGKIEWAVMNPLLDNNVVAAMAYHPNWNLYINGKKGKIIETNDHLVSFILPDAGENEVLLIFKKSLSEYIYYLITFISIGFCAWVVLMYNNGMNRGLAKQLKELIAKL